MFVVARRTHFPESMAIIKKQSTLDIGYVTRKKAGEMPRNEGRTLLIAGYEKLHNVKFIADA